MPSSPARRIIGRYLLDEAIASGGMATIHLGRLVGVGFSRIVAIKRLHAGLARSPEFVAMFLDEVRMASRIQHPNVINILDVVATDGELFLVMEYVKGDSLSRLLRAAKEQNIPPPVPTIVAMLSGALQGLHAAHVVRDENDQPMHIIHRDVSPQNILVGSDGMARIFDFGVAKAQGRYQSTARGTVKGKVRYMAPEQLRDGPVTHTLDIFAAGVVLFEALTGERMFSEDERHAVMQISRGQIRLPREVNPSLPPSLDDVVRKACAIDPTARYASAGEMAAALEACGPVASAVTVGAWVNATAREALDRRAHLVRRLEADAASDASLPDLLRASRPDTGEVAETAASPPTPLRVTPAPQPAARDPKWTAPHVAFASAAVVLALVGLGLTGFSLRTRAGAARPEPRPSPIEPAAARPQTKPPAEPVQDLPPSAATTVTAALPQESLDAGKTARLPSRPATESRPAPAAPSTNRATNCATPYTLDERGRAVFKPECLQ